MPESLPIWATIIIAGIVAGLLFGVSIQTGQDVSETGIMITVMKSFCGAMENIDDSAEQQTVKTCKNFLFWMIVISIVAGIVAVVEEVMRIGDWRVGLALYGLGWLIGLLMIILN